MSMEQKQSAAKGQPRFLLEQAGRVLWGWLRAPHRWAAFWAALLGGFACHMYVFTNMLPNHDWQHNFYATQNWISSGRWFLQYACEPSSFAILPWLTGVLSVVLLAGTAVLTVDVLDLHRPMLAGAAALMMVCFPAVGSTCTYIYTMDGYMLALFLSALAVWCMERWPKKVLGCIPAALCMGFSMGIYQAYGAVMLMLFCFMLVLKMLRRLPPLKEMFLYAVRMAATAAGGFAVYYLMLQVVMRLTGVELGGYQGIDNLGSGLSLSPQGLMTLVQMVLNAAYHGYKFLTADLPALGGVATAGKLVWLLYGCAALLWCVLAVARRQWKRWWAIPAQLALFCLVPVGVNYVQIISPEVSFHLVMHYAAVLVFVLSLCLTQEVMEEESLWMGLRQAASVVVPVACVVLAFLWAVMTNRGYTNMQYQYEETYADLVRLADRIEQCEGYTPDMKLWLSDNEWPVTEDRTLGDLTGLSGMGGMKLFDWLHYRNDFMYLFGLKFEQCSQEEYRAIRETQEFQEMPNWPSTGSVKVINGVMVVKTDHEHVED